MPAPNFPWTISTSASQLSADTSHCIFLRNSSSPPLRVPQICLHLHSFLRSQTTTTNTSSSRGDFPAAALRERERERRKRRKKGRMGRDEEKEQRDERRERGREEEEWESPKSFPQNPTTQPVGVFSASRAHTTRARSAGRLLLATETPLRSLVVHSRFLAFSRSQFAPAGG